jgi:hypothetical protein
LYLYKAQVCRGFQIGNCTCSAGKTLNFFKLYFNMTGRKLSDVERWQAAGMVIGGMSYRQTTERFNVSHSVIVRLKQRMNETGNAKERQRT